MRFAKVLAAVVFVTLSVNAQTSGPAIPRIPFAPLADDFSSNRPSTAPTSAPDSEYLIGKDDLLDVNVFELQELSSVPRVTASGYISLPLVGVVQAAGYTPHELERKIEDALKTKSVLDPHVTVFVREYASQPVTVMGAVRAPNIYQIKGQKYLLEMLAMAQGLDTNSAGDIIQVLRRPEDVSAQGETITISVSDLFQKGKSELNIPIKAGDTIHVTQAGSIFVIGEVNQPGEKVLRNGKNLTASQAIGVSNGFAHEAKKNQCIIIRIHQDGSKQEIPVNIAKIFDRSEPDVTLMPNDILFVPANKVKTGINRALETTIAALTARVVYRF